MYSRYTEVEFLHPFLACGLVLHERGCKPQQTYDLCRILSLQGGGFAGLGCVSSFIGSWSLVFRSNIFFLSAVKYALVSILSCIPDECSCLLSSFATTSRGLCCRILQCLHRCFSVTLVDEPSLFTSFPAAAPQHLARPSSQTRRGLRRSRPRIPLLFLSLFTLSID